MLSAGGSANGTAQDTFCAGMTCTISIIYDQSGRNNRLTQAPPGVPMTQRVLVETDETYTTGKWTVPGDYHLTCAVHPKMTVEVVVTDCCC